MGDRFDSGHWRGCSHPRQDHQDRQQKSSCSNQWETESRVSGNPMDHLSGEVQRRGLTPGQGSVKLFNLSQFLVESVTGRAILEMISDFSVEKSPIVAKNPFFALSTSHKWAESFSLRSILARWIRDLVVPSEIFRMVAVSS